uniref:OTU domain-containing protein n=1 Tax=Compsopogon caeruleus TaxID=31354 RepID=A0A7S1XFW6_9RHOD
MGKGGAFIKSVRPVPRGALRWFNLGSRRLEEEEEEKEERGGGVEDLRSVTEAGSSRSQSTGLDDRVDFCFPRGEPTLYRFRTAGDFRRHLMMGDARRRILYIPGTAQGQVEVFRFIPIAMDGSCGFAAVAKGVNAVKGMKFTPDKLRLLLRDQARSTSGFFAEEMARNAAYRFCVEEGGCTLDDFAASVVRKGVAGHWLGEKWQMVEVMALARVMQIRIDVFTYDEKCRILRRHDELNTSEAQCIGLLFSGPPSGGHFDLLLPT